MQKTEEFAKRMNTSMHYKLELLKLIDNRQGTIVDFGCGSGLVGIAAAKEFPDAMIYLYDVDPVMLSIAEDNIKEHRVTNAQVVKVLPTKFDHAIVSSVLHEVADPAATLQRLANSLSIGGSIILREGYKFNYRKQVMYRLMNPHVYDNFVNKVREYPNSILASWINGREAMVKNGYLVGDIQTVASILNKYTWGTESLYREADESYLEFNHQVITDLVKENNFPMRAARLHFEFYETKGQQDYFYYLNKVIDLNGDTWSTHVNAILRRIT